MPGICPVVGGQLRPGHHPNYRRAGCLPHVASSACRPEPAAENDQWVMVTAVGGLRGEMSVRLGAASVLRLAQAFMSEPAAPDVPLTPDHRESVIELLRQVAGIVASGAKARWGEVQLHLERAAAAPSWPRRRASGCRREKKRHPAWCWNSA